MQYASSVRLAYPRPHGDVAPDTAAILAQTHRNGALREQRASIRQSSDRHGMQTPSLHDLLRLTLRCQSTPIRRTGTTPAVPFFVGSCCPIVAQLTPRSTHRFAQKTSKLPAKKIPLLVLCDPLCSMIQVKLLNPMGLLPIFSTLCVDLS